MNHGQQQLRVEKIRLSRSAMIQGEPVEELDFREPTGRDLRAAGSAFNGDGTPDDMFEYRLIASCCGVPPSSIDALPIGDASNLRRLLGVMLQPPPQVEATGA